MANPREPFILVVSLWLKGEDVAAFEAFEREAARIMAQHGGRIEQAIRLKPAEPETPFEVHIVRFPNVEAFAAYRADPEARALTLIRERVIARTVIWEGENDQDS